MASMSSGGPRTFYCHQCNSRTHVSAEDFSCGSCGSGFIEEIVDPTPEFGGQWNRDAMSDAEHLFDAFLNYVDSGPQHEDRAQSNPGSQGRGRGQGQRSPYRLLGPDVGSGASLYISPGHQFGPGDQFLHSLLSNLTGIHLAPSHFQIVTGQGGLPGNVLYGNPGDYAWGRGGLDAIVTQLLNQMEGTGPPPMAEEDVSGVPTVKVTQQIVDQKLQCSVCWEDFIPDESVRKLTCEHIFHEDCIMPWLRLHATCPVCRKPQTEAAQRMIEHGEDTDDVGGRLLEQIIGSPSPNTINRTGDQGASSSSSPSTGNTDARTGAREGSGGEQGSSRSMFAALMSQILGNASPGEAGSRRSDQASFSTSTTGSSSIPMDDRSDRTHEESNREETARSPQASGSRTSDTTSNDVPPRSDGGGFKDLDLE